jgi:sodium/hydrogen antiporter
MTGLTIAASVIVCYALVASRLDRVWVSAPMVFVAAGLLLGPSATDVLPVDIDSEITLVVTELTLALILFADASTLRLAEVERDAWFPGRLLFIGLPLTVALGAAAAVGLFSDASWAAAALIAVILAPTDAALGAATVTNPVVPVRVRRALTVESGLNDGIVTPFVTLFLALLLHEEGLGHGHWLLNALAEIGWALLAAALVGALGGAFLRAAHRRGWTSPVSEQLAILALALLSYECAVAIGGNGFVAAFTSGLLFGATAGRAAHEPVEFTETVGLLASFLVWMIFGAVFVGPLLTGPLTLIPVVYAVLSLTLIRLLPVAAALSGTGLRRDTVAFVAWFGPRGLASVVFTLIAIEALHHHPAAQAISAAATWTILLSVLAHGITAAPVSAAYGRRLAGAGEIPELATGPEPRLRRRTLAVSFGAAGGGEGP